MRSRTLAMVFTLPEHINLFQKAVKENLRQKVELLSNVPGYQVCKEESIFALASLCRRVWVDPMQEVVSLRLLPATASGEFCC